MLADRHEIEQDVFLWTQADVLSDLFVFGGDVSAVDARCPIRRWVDTREDVDRRRLSEIDMITINQ